MACGQTPDKRPLYAVAEGDPAAVRDALLRGAAAPGTALLRRLGLKVGDELTLQTRHGPERLPIAGTVTEYTGGGLALYIDWQHAQQLFELRGPHVLMVTARPGATAALDERLQTLCKERGLMLQSGAQFRETFNRQSEGFEALIWMLIALVFVVASLGIVNTLTMNVLEQTRDFGVLRAVGLKRRQAARILIAQALGLCIISLAPGVAAGIGMAYLINLATYPILGQRVPFHVSSVHLAACVGGALVIVLLAALLPARRAARLPVVQALQYE
jgi:putative ABC transport system permease protein